MLNIPRNYLIGGGVLAFIVLLIFGVNALLKKQTTLHITVDDTADIYVDGRKVSTSITAADYYNNWTTIPLGSLGSGSKVTINCGNNGGPGRVRFVIQHGSKLIFSDATTQISTDGKTFKAASVKDPSIWPNAAKLSVAGVTDASKDIWVDDLNATAAIVNVTL